MDRTLGDTLTVFVRELLDQLVVAAVGRGDRAEFWLSATGPPTLAAGVSAMHLLLTRLGLIGGTRHVGSCTHHV
jgi:hypothetical protein